MKPRASVRPTSGAEPTVQPACDWTNMRQAMIHLTGWCDAHLAVASAWENPKNWSPARSWWGAQDTAMQKRLTIKGKRTGGNGFVVQDVPENYNCGTRIYGYVTESKNQQ